MNIVVIISDSLRWDCLGCYGNGWVRTPNLDRFARECVVFNRAYCGSFPTIPMRADLFTGRYVFQSRGWAPLGPEDRTFAQVLEEMGYVTMMITDTYHLMGAGMNFHRGFKGWHWIRGQEADRYITDPIPVELPCAPEKLRSPEADVQYLRNTAFRRQESDCFVAQTMKAAADWLERNYNHERFLLYVDTFDPHEPWDPPQWYVDLYDPGYEGEVVFHPRYDFSDYLTEEELRHVRALYAGEVTLVDKWVGRLLEKLEDLGLAERTAVIFTSDHGFYHGEHSRVGKHTVLDPKRGWPLYEEVAHVPLIIRLPGMKPGRCDALVQPVDLMATILDLAGAQAPEGIHGRSLLPVLRGEREAVRSLAVSSPKLAEDPDTIVYSTITDGEWTLIYGGEAVQAELYHLPSDPHQEWNLISQNRDVAERLHREYVRFLEELDTDEERLRTRRRI